MTCCTTEHCSCMGIKQFSVGKAIRCTAESCKNKSEPSCVSCKWYAEPDGVCGTTSQNTLQTSCGTNVDARNGRRKMKRQQTYKGLIGKGWYDQSEFSHRYACWANHRNNWAIRKADNRKLAKARLKQIER